MARFRVPAAIVLAVAIIGGLIAAGFAGGGPAPSTFDRLSNQGTAVTPKLGDARGLGKLERAGSSVRLLATRGGRSLYRVGSDCFAAGPASDALHRFGSLECTDEFPSAEHPVLDFTVLHGKLKDGKLADLFVWRSEGLAADGVASVAFRNAQGEIVGETPVQGNTYTHPAVPSGVLVELLALDASGDVIHAKRLIAR